MNILLIHARGNKPNHRGFIALVPYTKRLNSEINRTGYQNWDQIIYK